MQLLSHSEGRPRTAWVTQEGVIDYPTMAKEPLYEATRIDEAMKTRLADYEATESRCAASEWDSGGRRFKSSHPDYCRDEKPT